MTVIVAEPPEVTDEGENDTDAPAGAPLADSATGWAEPLVVAVEIVEEPVAPCAPLTLAGLAESEKSDAVTVSPTLVECVADAAVPVTVIV